MDEPGGHRIVLKAIEEKALVRNNWRTMSNIA